jgi:two-component system, chemotaxis family, sensor kinase CheA
MGKKDEAFLAKLMETFRVEAEDHIGKMSAGLLDLEKVGSTEERSRIAEIVFREAHSLKGAARAVNLGAMESVCQSLESVFGVAKRGTLIFNAELFDVLHQALDATRGLLSGPDEAERTGLPREILPRLERLVEQAGGLDTPPPPEILAHAPGGSPAAPIELSNTVRISTKKLFSLLLIAEEMLSVKVDADQRAAELTDLQEHAERWRYEWNRAAIEATKARPALESLAAQNARKEILAPIEKALDSLIAGQARIASLTDKVSASAAAAERARELSEGMWTNLLESARSALLFPFSSLLELFPRMIRDLAREQGKEAELVVRGDTIEVDRRILEEMKDPLIHMLRNAVGHGIEKPEERTRKGKPRGGTIAIEIAQRDGRTVELAVSDDGTGIDVKAVKASAVRTSAISRAESDGMSDRDALDLIFRSEVTTSRRVDGISGRGLGLAITFEKVKKLRGTISVESAPSTGTMFRILVPVSLASFRGVIVRVADRLFVIPTSAVRHVLRIEAKEIRTAGNREFLQIGEAAVPFSSLQTVLGLGGVREGAGTPIQALILEADEKTAAFGVDEIMSEQEILVKSLGRHLAHIRHVSGATILGSGRIVPILNVADLMKTVRDSAAPPPRKTVEEWKVDTEKKSILVVEDSITSRMLLKNILESAGYRVTTAVDGLEAFTELKTDAFDLVVSDIDMPRMNGFELTTRIRSDKAVAETPVILVTALDSREDRERGIDAGANAYIVKSSFDQGNLLDIISRMA